MVLKELLREHADVFTLTSEDRISTAAELMRQRKIGSVVIVENELVVGIITDRDIALTVTLGAATPDSLVREVMTTNV
jgi:CBS domain-containing protein